MFNMGIGQVAPVTGACREVGREFVNNENGPALVFVRLGLSLVVASTPASNR